MWSEDSWVAWFSPWNWFQLFSLPHYTVTNHKFNQIFFRRLNSNWTQDWTTRNFGNKIHRGEWIFALLILSRMNTLEEYLTKSSSLSKLYVPQKFIEMLSKFCSGQEFVEKLGILANFVNKCLHYFWTIL